MRRYRRVAALIPPLNWSLDHVKHASSAAAAASFDFWGLLPSRRRRRDRLPASPLRLGRVGPAQPVPANVPRPDYAAPGAPPMNGPPSISKRPEIHGPDGIARMRAACRLAAAALARAGALAAPGVPAEALDAAAHDAIVRRGGYPSPLAYGGFPKSVCTSVNEVGCHGIPDDRPLEDGDIVNVDVTAYLGGYHGDTNATFYVGQPRPAAVELVEATREALAAAVAACGPGAPFAAIGAAIQTVADRARLAVVRELVGHGIGRTFHAAPAVLHYRNNRPGTMAVGQTFTIEPILTLGSRRHRCLDDGWTLVTVDGSLAAQFEHTVLVTEDGAEVLTVAGDAGGDGDDGRDKGDSINSSSSTAGSTGGSSSSGGGIHTTRSKQT